VAKRKQDHLLAIVSTDDAQAVCKCGNWRFIHTGPLTQDVNVRIEEEYQRHLLVSGEVRKLVKRESTKKAYTKRNLEQRLVEAARAMVRACEKDLDYQPMELELCCFDALDDLREAVKAYQ